MTSRERIISAVEHREPDAVPIDLGATPSSGISAIAYGNLKKHLGISKGQIRIYDVVQQLAQPEDDILDRFGIDAVDAGRAFNDRDGNWYDVVLADGQQAMYPAWFHPEQTGDGSWIARNRAGVDIARMPAGGTFFDQSAFPWIDGYPDDIAKALPDAIQQVLWAEFAHSPWDHAAQPDFWLQLRNRVQVLRNSTDRAIVMACGCNLFEWGCFVRRMDNFMMDLFTEVDRVRAFLDAIMVHHMRLLEQVCAAVGDLCDVLRFGDDLGMDSGPFMPARLYRELFKPHHNRLCEYVHKNSAMKTFLHSCGSIHELLPDMIDAGFDVINPVQTSCRDMEPERLKKDFGNDICFWGGGCDTRTILNRASPAEVRRHVLDRLDIFAPGGGFVFNTVHNILPEVPPQNVVAMYEAIKEFNHSQ